MDQPKKTPGSRLCLVLTKRGLKAYGNASAFRSLADWLHWLAQSSPAEHYECHVGMDLESEESKFGEGVLRNVWVLTDDVMSSVAEKRRSVSVDDEQVEFHGFDLGFMMVSEDDLDEMARHQESGMTPPNWTADE